MKRIPARFNFDVNSVAGRFSDVHDRVARSMIGQAVTLLTDANTVARGIVSDVLPGIDDSQIVVDGACYHLEQILTTVPAAFA